VSTTSPPSNRSGSPTAAGPSTAPRAEGAGLDETQVDGGASPAPDPRSPRVSIGLLVWNGERFLQQGLESLLNQSFEDFELIISDNGSTDATEAISREYMSRDRRIRYYRNERNIGLQANTEKVLDLATAPYFMWACHDDRWDRSYLAKLVDQLDHGGSLVLAGSNAASIDENGTLRTFYDNQGIYAPGSTYARARRLIAAHPQGGHAFLLLGLLRTQVAQRMGLASYETIRIHNRGKYAWDKRALFRLVFEGDFYVSNETLFFHRDTNDEWWDTRRTTPRTISSQLRRAVLHSLDLHDYFASLRGTVLASRLSAGQKVSLVALSGLQELRYLGAYYLSHLRP
jgi:glycosyltransferase involved in cell wall biosynthesis